MKNPRLLLTAFLTCCMTAAPQNAAAQSPMRTSSSVPPQVELMYVKGLRYLQNAQKTDGTYDGTYGREPGIIGFALCPCWLTETIRTRGRTPPWCAAA